MDSLSYLEHVKTLDCIVYGCHDPVTAHHRDALGQGSKKRKKPAKEHLSAIPICIKHHTELHQMGQAKFEKAHKLSLDKESLRILINWMWFNECDGIDEYFHKGKK